MKNRKKMNKTKDLSNKKIFLSKRGETIMETLVSLLIMGILITSLLSIIRFSLVLSGDSLRNAADSQGRFNDLIHGTVAGGQYAGGSATLTIRVESLAGGTVNATQVVNMSSVTDANDDPIFQGAFIPAP